MSKEKPFPNRLPKFLEILDMPLEKYAASIGQDRGYIRSIANGRKPISAQIAISTQKEYHESHGVTVDWLWELTDALDIPKEKESEDKATLVLDCLQTIFKLKTARHVYRNINMDVCTYDYFTVTIDKSIHDLLRDMANAETQKELKNLSNETYLSMVTDAKQKYNQAVESGDLNSDVDLVLIPNGSDMDDILNKLCMDAIDFQKCNDD